jgi:hypothetical protein
MVHLHVGAGLHIGVSIAVRDGWIWLTNEPIGIGTYPLTLTYVEYIYNDNTKFLLLFKFCLLNSTYLVTIQCYWVTLSTLTPHKFEIMRGARKIFLFFLLSYSKLLKIRTVTFGNYNVPSQEKKLVRMEPPILHYE